MPEDPGAERILRGAIVLELNLASRYANEVANRELRAAGVDPDEYGFLSVVGILQPVTRARLLRAIDEALDGKLDEYEESVWTVRVSLQRLAAADATPAGGRVPRAE